MIEARHMEPLHSRHTIPKLRKKTVRFIRLILYRPPEPPSTRVLYVIPAEPVRVNWSATLADAPGYRTLPTFTPISGEPAGPAQLVTPAAFTSVALLLRLSSARDIGPAIGLAPMLRIVTSCWKRPVPKLKEKPPRITLIFALMSLA